MRDPIPLIAFLSIIFATLIGTAVGLHFQRTHAATRRQELLREFEAARRGHRASEPVRRKLVQATTEQLRSEV